MRKLCTLIAVCLALCPIARAEAPRPILYSAYLQQGWGDRVAISAIDEAGGLWTLSGYASSMGWPDSPAEQALYLSAADSRAPAGALGSEELTALKSLVAAVEGQGDRLSPGQTLDYGTTRIYAVRYDADGTPDCVLLYAYGDNMFANTDYNAQALTLALARAFSDGAEFDPGQLPGGFQPVALSAFCGYDPAALANAAVSAVLIDCEAGPQALEVSDGEAESLRRLAREGRVTGKANALCTTGGYVVFAFTGADGGELASFSLYHGLLVREDGMYTLDWPK